MLHWRKLFARALHTPPPAGAPAGAGSALHLVLVSRDAVQAAALQRIAGELGWTFALASSAAAAAALPAAGPTVVVFDREMPDGDWRQALPRLAALPHACCVLLATVVADEYLWQEVSRHGGDELLAKPWKSAELRRVVAFATAWRTWSGG
jgi:CheY-like chemotaxis protein